jgi:hypothetical protein
MSKKTKTGREVLEEALLISCSDYYDQFPSYEGEIDPGEEYEKAMNALIRRSKKPKPRYFNTLSKRVAGIAAALLIVFGCSMTVSAVRLPFVEFLSNTYDKYVEIFFDSSDIEKAPSVIETVYTLGYVPEGYEQNLHCVEKDRVILVWKNKENCSIELRQNVLDSKFAVDTEGTDVFSFNIDDCRILFKEKYGQKTYFWNTNEYQFYLYITDDGISTEDGVELIRSIMEYK